MKFFLLIFLTFTSLCFAENIVFFEDSSQNQQYRLSVANSNLEAVSETLSYIQTIIKKEPERAIDLICIAMKYLNSAMDCLNNNEVHSLNFYKESNEIK